MGEHTTLFERAASRYTEPELSKDGLLLRRHRKLRNKRVAAGVLGTAVFAFVAIGFVWLLGSEGGPVVVPASPSPPDPSSSVTTSFTERFDSPMNDLSIGYPAGWKVRPATEPWSFGKLSFDASEVDVIFDPTLGDDLYLALVSKPLGDLSRRDWVDDLRTPGICAKTLGAGSGPFVLDHPTYYTSTHCSGGGRSSGSGAFLRFVAGKRGYLIYAHIADIPALNGLERFADGHHALGETYLDLFQGMLDTLELG